MRFHSMKYLLVLWRCETSGRGWQADISSPSDFSQRLKRVHLWQHRLCFEVHLPLTISPQAQRHLKCSLTTGPLFFSPSIAISENRRKILLLDYSTSIWEKSIFLCASCWDQSNPLTNHRHWRYASVNQWKIFYWSVDAHKLLDKSCMPTNSIDLQQFLCRQDFANAPLKKWTITEQMEFILFNNHLISITSSCLDKNCSVLVSMFL